MSHFAGIDFDTHAIHIVLISEDEEKPVYYRHDLPAVGDAFERTREVAQVLPARRSVFWDGIIAIGIEEPMGHSTRPLNRVQGAILSCLPPTVLVNPMMPGQWRKAVGLAGNATKEDVAVFVGSQLWPDAPLAVKPASTWPQDACDAYCLALAVQKLTTPVPT
jgi:hypothetical protein